MEHGRGAMVSKRVPGCLCGAAGVRDETCDAYYCPVSSVWLEERCSDPACEFCPTRPDLHEPGPIYIPGFVRLEAGLAWSVFDILDRELPWENRDAPRDECFLAKDVSLSYSYGRSAAVRRTYRASEMHPTVAMILEQLNGVMWPDGSRTAYNVCVLNRYASRHEHLGWHADDSPEQDPAHPIAVVSFGAARFIYVRRNGFKGPVPDANKFLLEPGSLFVMPPGFQETHQHKIPKHDQECGPRISLTFRKLDRTSEVVDG